MIQLQYCIRLIAVSVKESYPLIRTQKRYYQVTDQDNIITLVHIDSALSRAKFPEVREPGAVNGYLKKIKIFCDVPNLPFISVPTLEITSSPSEAYAIQKEVEWHSPGWGIKLWTSKRNNPSNRPESNDWVLVGYHSVINTGVWRQYDSYPIFSDNLADELEDGDRIGVSIYPRTVNGVVYFPVLTAPFLEPENRPDSISFDVSWVQDLIITKPDPQPIFLTVFSTTTSGGTQVQQKPPVLVIKANDIVLTGELNTINNTPCAVEVSDLLPSGEFNLAWYSGTNKLTESTQTADATGKRTINFNSNQFAGSPFLGTAQYYARATQLALSTNSSAFTARHPTIRPDFNPLRVGSTMTFTAEIFDYRDSLQVRITVLKNGIELTDWFFQGTPVFFTGNLPHRWRLSNIPTWQWYNEGWGVGNESIYRLKAVANNVTFISDLFSAQTYVAPSKG